MYTCVPVVFTHAVEGAIRLVGNTTANEGRVEVYHNGIWGTVCDNSWNITNANVVCLQLGYCGATSAPGGAFFGQGSGPIHYNNVACNGNETRLVDCFYSGIEAHNCNHSKDAGVVCATLAGELKVTCLSLNADLLRRIYINRSLLLLTILSLEIHVLVITHF